MSAERRYRLVPANPQVEMWLNQIGWARVRRLEAERDTALAEVERLQALVARLRRQGYAA